MPSRTLEDKVDELSRTAAALTEQTGNLQSEAKTTLAQLAEVVKDVADLKTRMALLERQAGEWAHIKEQLGTITDLKVAIALLEHGVEELKQTRDEWSRRFWAMAGPILGAVVGVLLGYFLRK